MKFLITGGAGFIGSAVIRHIINNSTDSVINLDKLTYAGNLESLQNISNSERYFFEKGDIHVGWRVQPWSPTSWRSVRGASVLIY